MIVKLMEKDRESLYGYLKKEAAINTFIIGDVENFGFESEKQDLWADLSEEGEYKAVLLRYRTHFIIYATEKYDVAGFIKLVNSYEFTDISGKEEIIDEVINYIKIKGIKKQYFCKLDKENFKNIEKNNYNIEYPEISDADSMCKLRNEIKEFSQYGNTTLQNMKELVSGESGRTFLIKDGDKVISMASSEAETQYSSMVVNVCTSPDKRGQGLASACVGKLCEEILNEGKVLCLFYDNPKAGSIYKRLGFRDIGKWTSLFL